MSERCQDCGKVLQSRKAYAGHMLLAHGKRVGFMAEFDAKMRIVDGMASELMQMQDAIAVLDKAICGVYAKVTNNKDNRDKLQNEMNALSDGYLGLQVSLCEDRQKAKAKQQDKVRHRCKQS